MSKQEKKNELIKPDELKYHIAEVSDKGFNKDRFSKMALMAISENPSLQKCSRLSLFKELVKCARQGLMPDGKEAALVPFRRKDGGFDATLMPMTWGLAKLARQSGEVKSLAAFLVREGEPFQIKIDADGQSIRHEPDP